MTETPPTAQIREGRLGPDSVLTEQLLATTQSSRSSLHDEHAEHAADAMVDIEDVRAPASLAAPLRVQHKSLMGAGPSNAPPRVMHAGSLPLLGHMYPETFQVLCLATEGKNLFVKCTRGKCVILLQQHPPQSLSVCSASS